MSKTSPPRRGAKKTKPVIRIQALFTRSHTWGGWRGSPYPEGIGSHYMTMTMCGEGVSAWFNVPKYCKSLYLVVSNDPRGGYLLHERSWGSIFVQHGRSDRQVLPLSVEQWIRGYVGSVNRRKLYISIEVKKD